MQNTLAEELRLKTARKMRKKIFPSIDRIMGEHHPKQADAVGDEGRLIAVLGTRRCGKSRGFLRRMIYDAITIPSSYQVYINTSWPECRRIAWRGARPGDGLLSLNSIYGLGATFIKTERSMIFPNDSLVECIPADDPRSIERALGLACHRVWIDEAQKMPHLDYAVREVLGPTMTDFDGQMVLTGTPSRDCSGLFYEVTKDDSELTGWNVHHFSVLDNPFFGDTKEQRYQQTIRNHCLKFNLEEDDPEVQREWFGRWVVEDANFVYHVHRVNEDSLLYAPARYMRGKKPNHLFLGGTPDIAKAILDLPLRADGRAYDWLFGAGFDLGYEPDPFAYTIWAWTIDLPILYELASWKQIRLIPDEQAQIIGDLHHTAPFSFAGADAGGGGKAIVRGWSEGWLDRYPIPIEEAPKSNKTTAIEMLNNDIRAGRVRLRANGPLHAEMQKLTWTQSKGNARRVENVRRDTHGRKRCPNDCCDSALYGHRLAQHHLYTEPVSMPEYGSSAYWRQEEDRIEAEILAEIEGNSGAEHFH
jgi:hypothetical protein